MLWPPLGEECGSSFEQTWIPITQEYFVPSLDEISPMALEKRSFRYLWIIFAISLLSPFAKERGPSFAHHPRMLCAKFGWNWSRTWFWRRRRERKKFTTTTKTYNGQSWFEPLAKVSQNLLVIIVWYIIPLDIIGKIKLSTRSPLKLEVEVESEGESSLFAMMYSCLESQADRRPTFAGLSKDSKKNKWYVLRF